MKKKIIAVISALLLAFNAAAFAAEGPENTVPERVEISFKVGDSVLTVNGENLEVMAPYVIGEGTTLVPVRVITEAFGAEVGWDGDTKTVTLSYPDVEISLVIGSKTATVNDHTEELPEAPELYNGTTMVPLRFISETFDAEVTFEDETKLITVVKDSQDEQPQLETGTDQPYIGDSYYGWSIKNPTVMEMEERSFDGAETVFSNDDGTMVISVGKVGEDVTSDDLYNSALSLVQGMTVSAADKTTEPSGNIVIHIRARDKDKTVDYYGILKDKTFCRTVTMVNNGSENMNDILDIAGSLSISQPADMYDMSNVEGGYRIFEDDDMKLSFKLPADYYRTETNYTNIADFTNADDYGKVTAALYSKTDTITAASVSEEDHARVGGYSNPNISEVSDISDITVAGIPAKQYTIKYSGDGILGKYVMKDTYFELGEYVYNITCRMSSEAECNALLDSLKVEELDAEAVGTILKDTSVSAESTVKLGTKTITLPENWRESTSVTSNVVKFILHGYTSSILTVTKMDDVQRTELSSLLSSTANNTIENFKDRSEDAVGAEYEKHLSTETLGGKTYYTITLKCEYTTETIYDTLYAAVVDGDAYVFDLSCRDINYNSTVEDEAEQIISSLK